VEAFMGRLLASPLDLRSLKGTKLCAVGPATGERLARYGLKVDLVPAESRAEAVVHAMVDQGAISGQKVLLPRSDIGREVIAEELRKRGADVTEVVAYRTVALDLERDGAPDIYVCNDFSSPDRIWINQGRGRFQAVGSDRQGIRLHAGGLRGQ